MYIIRKGIFETNSSECHALIIPREQGIDLTRTIDLSADDDKGDIFRWLVRNIEYEEAKKLANFFYRNRVDTIIYTGSNGDLIRAIKEEKEAFEKNPDRILEIPRVPHCYGFEFEDYLHLFFGTGNYDYFGHDGYLPKSDEAQSIYIGCGG